MEQWILQGGGPRTGWWNEYLQGLEDWLFTYTRRPFKRACLEILYDHYTDGYFKAFALWKVTETVPSLLKGAFVPLSALPLSIKVGSCCSLGNS